MQVTAEINPEDMGKLTAALERLRTESPLTNRQVVKKGYIAFMLAAASKTPKSVEKRDVRELDKVTAREFKIGKYPYTWAVDVWRQWPHKVSGRRMYPHPVAWTRARAEASPLRVIKHRGLARLIWKKMLSIGTSDTSGSGRGYDVRTALTLTTVRYDAVNSLPYIKALDDRHGIMSAAARSAAGTIDREIEKQAEDWVKRRWRRL